MRIITGALVFFDSSAGIIMVTPPVILLPNPPPVYSLMKTILLGVHVQPARDGGQSLRSALRAGVQEQLAILPVGHRGARFQSLMAGVRRDERFIEHERGILETGIQIAVRPFVGRLAHGQAIFFHAGKVSVRPLQRRDLRLRA